MADPDALRAFADSLLRSARRLRSRPRRRAAGSLQAFLQHNARWETAAAELFVHRHTLRYRMRKVEELTGRDLSSSFDRMEFWLALRARDLQAAQIDGVTPGRRRLSTASNAECARGRCVEWSVRTPARHTGGLSVRSSDRFAPIEEGNMADSHQMFIGGEWVNSSDGETRDIISPAHGRGHRGRPGGIGRGRRTRGRRGRKKAFDETWFDSTPKDRQLALLKLADAIEANADEFVRIESENAGKPGDGHDVGGDPADRRQPPVLRAARRARSRAGAPGSTWPGFTSIVRREPIGVAGLIAPWNYPLMMAVWKIGPALAAGNTIVLKPSELTPLSTIKLARARLPTSSRPGVFNVVTGDGVPVGDTLVRHPDVGIVSLTGDVGTGKLIHEERRRHPEARAPRARGEGAGRRVRRRRHRVRRRVDLDRRVLQRGAGLHRGLPRARRRTRSTTRCSATWCPRSRR